MERLRPTVRNAAQALCDADTPDAALAASEKLDVVCLRAGLCGNLDVGAAQAIGNDRLDEAAALAEALLCGMSWETVVALLRSGKARALSTAAMLIYAATFNLRLRHVLPQAAALLNRRVVLFALTEALIKAEATASLDVPVAGGAPTRTGLGRIPPLMPLDDMLVALYELCKMWPGNVKKLLDALQRPDLMRCLARRYRPLERYADEDGPEGSVHRSTTTLLQLFSGVSGQLVWDTSQLVRSMLECLQAQAAAACARPLPKKYVPNEAAAACTILCNLIGFPTISKTVEEDARISALCKSSLPAALRALLGDASALLNPEQESLEALSPVLDLVFRFLETSVGRQALLGDASDHGGKLVLVLQVLANLVTSTSLSSGGSGGNFLCRQFAQHALAALAREAATTAVATSADKRVIELAYQSAGVLWLLKREQPKHRDDGSRMQAFEAMKAMALRLGYEMARDSDGCWTFTPQQRRATRELAHHVDCSPFNKVWREYACAYCDAKCSIVRSFQVCARCRGPHYCSAVCQKAHWKESHKRECVLAAPR